MGKSKNLQSNQSLINLVLFFFLGCFTFASTNLSAQSFVTWNDGGVFARNSTLTTIDGTYPGGTVKVTQTGAGNSFTIGKEFNIRNLNGANASEVFGTVGPSENPPSKSLTFTFSNPVTVHSFNLNDIDNGSYWDGGLAFSDIVFSSVNSGGGVVANDTGTTVVPLNSGGMGDEYGNWLNSTTEVTSFTLNYLVNSGKTHDYLGYSMEVTPGALPISIVGDTLICLGDSVLLTAVNDSVFSWVDMSAPSNVLSTDTFFYATPTRTTTYAVFGTSDTAYHKVNVDNSIQTVNLGNDTRICVGQSFLLDETQVNASSYLWQDNSTNPTFMVTGPGIYWLEITSTCGTYRDSVLVNLDSAPVVNLGNDTTICEGETTLIDASFPFSTYLWNDNSSSTTNTITQTEMVWVQVSNSCGSVTDSIFVNFKLCETELEMPDIFSPNKDGFNDLFLPIRIKKVVSAELQIYNRWGSEIYRNGDVSTGWDGTHNGNKSAEGTYFWIVNYTDLDNVSFTINGYVTLFR
jgi:gliding motility-associated-like protein